MKLQALSQVLLAFVFANSLGVNASVLTERLCLCKNANTLVIDALASDECCVQTDGQILNEGCGVPQNEREDEYAQCCLTYGDIGSCVAG